jgi:hypothetical protein
MKHNCGNKPAIRVELNQDTMNRIVNGPLRITGGKGAAPWVRKLIIKELDRYETIQSGKTQINSKLFE